MPQHPPLTDKNSRAQASALTRRPTKHFWTIILNLGPGDLVYAVAGGQGCPPGTSWTLAGSRWALTGLSLGARWAHAGLGTPATRLSRIVYSPLENISSSNGSSRPVAPGPDRGTDRERTMRETQTDHERPRTDHG